MQLDFLKRLLGPLQQIIAPAPMPAAPVPAPRPAAPRHRPSAELEAQARDWLLALGEHALAARLQVHWNPRLRSTAGLAYPHHGRVALNPLLQAHGAGEVERTLKHEVAHLLAHQRAGRRRISAHGPEWRQACVDLGLHDETRCHDLPLPRRTVAHRLQYRCPGCHTVVARVRPLRRASACAACCKKHNGGRFDLRFKLVKLRA